MADNRRFTYSFRKIHGWPAKRPKTLRCLWCKGKIDVQLRGRLPEFCSHSCRQRAYEQRKWRQPHMVALRKDLGQVVTDTAIRKVAWQLLQQAGLVTTALPPEPPRRKRPVELRLVRPTDESGSAE